MPWIKPEFQEVSLCGEVTAYVNTDKWGQLLPDGTVEQPTVGRPVSK